MSKSQEGKRDKAHRYNFFKDPTRHSMFPKDRVLLILHRRQIPRVHFDLSSKVDLLGPPQVWKTPQSSLEGSGVSPVRRPTSNRINLRFDFFEQKEKKGRISNIFFAFTSFDNDEFKRIVENN